MTGKKEYNRSITVILFFIVAGFILYFPVLGNTFLSDDYDSLYRIYIEKRILYREYLRPMIDISFYFNYFISALSPKSFYVFNLLVHILNALLLFRLIQSIEIVDEKNQFLFAFISSFLFLIYPFHNESIVWLSGRLSSMACLFALLCLILSKEKRGIFFIFLATLCYFIGLLCYETTLVLPLLIIILNWKKYKATKKIVSFSIYWAGATTIYFLTRFLLSESVKGNYGSRLIDDHIKEKLLNIGKVTGRLFLPPSNNQQLMIVLLIALFIVLIAIHRYLFKNDILKSDARFNYLTVLMCLAISLVIPFAFGLSTHTSEGDRLLYFPSCFLCIAAGSLIVIICEKPLYWWLTLVVFSFYFIFFLELNNQHWIKASVTAQSIMNLVKNNKKANIVFINLPEEWEGAFIFRNGFKKALLINKIDTNTVTVFNYLKRDDYLKTSAVIEPVIKDDGLMIFPFVHVSVKDQNKIIFANALSNEKLIVEKERNLIYYWDKEKLVRLF